MDATYPVIEDRDVPPPRLLHIRTTVFGLPWPFDVPAFCGVRPQVHWHLAHERPTCIDCLRRAPRGWRFDTETSPPGLRGAPHGPLPNDRGARQPGE